MKVLEKLRALWERWDFLRGLKSRANWSVNKMEKREEREGEGERKRGRERERENLRTEKISSLLPVIFGKKEWREEFLVR